MYRRIAVKVGSNVLTRQDGTLNVTRLSAIVDQIAEIRHAGIDVILVSSGAMASGRGELHMDKERIAQLDEVAQRQLFSAVGQAKLINRYYDFLREHHIPCGQVLCQKENFTTGEELKNMHACMEVMLQHGVLPVVNENDVVSITELMFTDNDELSGEIAKMTRADALFILSNIDGMYDGDPDSEDTHIIQEVPYGHSVEEYVQNKKSSAGRGGMQSKCHTAQTVAEAGIEVFLARGTREHVLTDLVFKRGNVPHTHFSPKKQSL